MKVNVMMAIAAGVVLICATGKAHAQWEQPPKTGSPQEMLEDRTNLAGQSGLGPLMTAELANPHDAAKQHRAVVEVKVDGVLLVDPAGANHVPKLSQGHLQYQLDGGQPVDSTDKRMEFSNLSAGEHRIKVTLMSNDNQPVGEPTTLTVHVR